MIKLMMPQPTNVALLACGSFNPLTFMHLRMFELAKDHLQRNGEFRVVSGIISPVHDSYPTNKKLEHSKHRCEMVKRSLTPLRGQDHWVKLDAWECEQSKWMNTRNVMQHHYETINKLNCSDRSLIGGETIRLMLLCGADMFDTFNVPNLWKDDDIKDIIGRYGIVVITREGFNPWKTLSDSGKSEILLKQRKNIHIVTEEIQNTVSSTAVRNAIKNGKNIRYHVPDSVISYIEDNGLYQD